MLEYWANKWAAALESGEYEQGEGGLRKVAKASDGCSIPECCPVTEEKTTFCCLGVLTDVVMKEMPNLGKWEASGFLQNDRDVVWHTNDYTPTVIQQITGLGGHNPILYTEETDDEIYGKGVRKISAAQANDDENKTFSDIAGHIRQNYKDM